VRGVGLEVDRIQDPPRLIVLALGDFEVGGDVAERLSFDIFVRSLRALPGGLSGTTIG
jgi:hypothetical protein